jgi:hypothetical protein
MYQLKPTFEIVPTPFVLQPQYEVVLTGREKRNQRRAKRNTK